MSERSANVLFVRSPTGDIEILGKAIFSGTEEQLVAILDDTSRGDARTLVVTPNVDQVLLLREDRDWRRAYQRSDIRVADGMPIVVLARLVGGAAVQRITGADLLPHIAAKSASSSLRVAIIGGSTAARENGVANLMRDNPGAQIKGFDLPHVQSVADPASRAAVAQLNAWEPNITFICLGSPKQELWFCAWEDELPSGVYVGAGAAIDFAAGLVPRAPRWAQQLSLEWMWRLAHEPRRLARRYLVRGPAFLGVAWRSLRKR